MNRQLRDALAQARQDLVGAEQLIHTREADLAASVMGCVMVTSNNSAQTHDRQRVTAQLYSGETNNAQVIAELRNNLSAATQQRDALVNPSI